MKAAPKNQKRAAGKPAAPFSPRQSKTAASQRLSRPFVVIALTLLAAVGLFRIVWYSPWYQERLFSQMSIPALQTLAIKQPNDLRLLTSLGRRLNKEQRFSEADGYLRQAVGLNPSSADLREEWARALLGSGLVTAAFEELREFTGTHPLSPQAHLIFGKFYVSQNSMRRASEELSEAVRLDPKLGEGWQYLSAAQDNLGNLAQAAEAAQKAASLRPNDPTAQARWADLLARLNHSTQAESVYTQSIQKWPQDASLHLAYASWLLHYASGAQSLSRAESEARRAAALDPNAPGTQLALGQALMRQGKAAEAVAPLRSVAETTPDLPASALALSQALRQSHQDNEAQIWDKEFRKRQKMVQRKTDLLAAVERDPKQPQPQLALAHFLALQGDVAGCLRHHADAARCAPDSPPALAAAAVDLSSAGHLDAALPMVRRAVQISPNSPTAQEALGDVLTANGQLTEAADAYDKAVLAFPNRASLYKKRIADYLRQHHVLSSHLQ